MTNGFVSKPVGRQPRGIFSINGTPIPYEKINVTNNNVYEADKFSATIALSACPTNIDANYFALLTDAYVTIYIGFPANPNPGQYSTGDLDTIFAGQIDNMDIDEISNTVYVTGRDLTAKFIDNKTTEKFQNLTASQIAILLANRRGLTPVVTPTTTKAGVFYSNNHTLITDQTSEWDLLVFLAQQESFLVYVDGQNLVFEPSPEQSAHYFPVTLVKPTATNGSPSCNVIQPRFSRSLTVAKDVVVIGRSWNRGSKQSYNVRITATHNTKAPNAPQSQPVGKAQIFSFVKNGLTKQQLIELAQQKLQEITSQEIIFTFTAPGTNEFKKDSVIKTQGFATALNQYYYPDSIIRDISNVSGSVSYSMRVHSKNHSPISTVIT